MREEKTRFLIIGDLHGHVPKLHFKEFDAILAPGDFCSDAGMRSVFFRLLRKRQADKDFDKEWYDLIGKKKARQKIMASLKIGRGVLSALNKLGKKVFAVPGNWDHTGHLGVSWMSDRSGWRFEEHDYYKSHLVKGLSNIRDVYMKMAYFKDYAIIGWGASSCPELPLFLYQKRSIKGKAEQKVKKKYDSWFDKLDRLFKRAKKDKKKVILLTHNVPYRTRLDKISKKESPAYGEHYGSLLARQLIDKHHPLVCVGGHIHENFGRCRLGKTLCINAGFGPKVNVLLETKGSDVRTVFYDSKHERP
ncbi:MAG: metallophosphoesterase [Nanoarchaeota archaeon]|nr:metallophosphoesterase [Nanoarchaeota archaeon]